MTMEIPKCDCFRLRQEDGLTRGVRITDSMGLDMAQTLQYLMAEHYVCDDAADYVLVNVLAGLLLLNVSQKMVRDKGAVQVGHLPEIEAGGRAILGQLSDALTERIAIIEMGLLGKFNQRSDN